MDSGSHQLPDDPLLHRRWRNRRLGSLRTLLCALLGCRWLRGSRRFVGYFVFDRPTLGLRHPLRLSCRPHRFRRRPTIALVLAPRRTRVVTVSPLGGFRLRSIGLRRIRSVGGRDGVCAIGRLRRIWLRMLRVCFRHILTRSAGLPPAPIDDGVYDCVQAASVDDGLGHVAGFDHGDHSTAQHGAEHVLGAVETRAGVPDVDEDVILPNAWLHVYLKRSGPLRGFQLVCPFSMVSGGAGRAPSEPWISRPARRAAPGSGRICGGRARLRTRDRPRSRRCAGSSRAVP